MFEVITRFLIRHKRTVLIVMAFITLFFITQIARMEMFTQFLDLFPKNHPYVEIHKKYAKYFGGAYQATLMLEVKEGDIFNTVTLEKISRIQDAVDLIPGVDHFAIYSLASPKVTVVRETPYGFSQKQIMKEIPKNEEEMEELKKKVFTSPVSGTLVSRDQKALLLNANFIEGRIDFKVLFNRFMEIKKREEDKNHRIYLTGTPLLYGWIYHYVPHMALIFILTSLMILGMLYAYMSQGGMWFWPFVSAIVCSIWGLGFSALLGYHFDPLIIVVPFLLSARAMSHGVQWVERFGEEYIKLGDIEKAAYVTGANLFPPGIVGIISDMFGLLIIALAPIPTLRNLAFLGTFWASASIFTVLVLFPPLFASFKRVKVSSTEDAPSATRFKYFTDDLLKRILTEMSGWTFGKGRWITVGISIIILIIAVFTSAYLKYGDANPGSPILWQDSEYNKDVEQTNRRFPGVDQMWVVIEGKREEGKDYPITYPDVVRGMEDLKYHMMEDPNVGFAVSVADLIKGINMLAHGNDPKMEMIPSEQKGIQDLVQLYAMGASPGELDPWISPDFGSSNVKFYLKSHEGTLLEEVINRMRKFINDNPKLMENAEAKPAGGLGGILAAANEVIASRNHLTLIFILAMIFIYCAIIYRSILAGIIFTLSLILANFLAFSYMVIKNIGLNINTFPVVSLGIGLGVDYGLYIVSRIIEVYREEKDLKRAVHGGIVTSGRAVFFTATMMSAGVFLWYFSPLRFQAEMGILLGILMMVNMIVGIMVLPAVINIIKPKFICRDETRDPHR
ncbi:MAG: MMPL family transporter [Syntrophorhabdaceae bacterium]|nr:MMPL family transporter [Syntrophorhabdaceae bacterium]